MSFAPRIRFSGIGECVRRLLTTVNSETSALRSAKARRRPRACLYPGGTHSSSSGIWVGVFAITMSFAAFTSALFVREGTADWSHLSLPGGAVPQHAGTAGEQPDARGGAAGTLDGHRSAGTAQGQRLGAGHAASWLGVLRWTISCVARASRRRNLPGDESEQLVLLPADFLARVCTCSWESSSWFIWQDD